VRTSWRYIGHRAGLCDEPTTLNTTTTTVNSNGSGGRRSIPGGGGRQSLPVGGGRQSLPGGSSGFGEPRRWRAASTAAPLSENVPLRRSVKVKAVH